MSNRSLFLTLLLAFLVVISFLVGLSLELTLEPIEKPLPCCEGVDK